jgi:hypothetical protein
MKLYEPGTALAPAVALSTLSSDDATLMELKKLGVEKELILARMALIRAEISR